MRRLIIVFSPFDAKQKYTIVQSKNVLKNGECTLDSLIPTLSTEVNEYGINFLVVSGLKAFAEKYMKEFEEYSMTKFNKKFSICYLEDE